jgi:GNAT superfamily N-acetyltransferase
MSDARTLTRGTAAAATIAPARPGDLDAVRALFREYAGSVDAPSCFAGFEQELARLPGDCAPPSGGILLARDARSQEAAGVVAFHALAPGLAEMKRLYVRPAWRGQGLGRRLVEATLAAAASSGHAAVRLSTLPEAMPAADALYRDLGFRPIPPYAGAGCAATCYELAL